MGALVGGKRLLTPETGLAVGAPGTPVRRGGGAGAAILAGGAAGAAYEPPETGRAARDAL